MLGLLGTAAVVLSMAQVLEEHDLLYGITAYSAENLLILAVKPRTWSRRVSSSSAWRSATMGPAKALTAKVKMAKKEAFILSGRE